MGLDSEHRIQVRMLGTFEVLVGGRSIPDSAWPRRKTSELLKVLLIRPGERLTIDQLIEALWPEASPASATRNVQARVSELRRVLEPDLRKGSDSKYVKHVGEGYALALGDDLWLDTGVFRSQLAEAHDLADRGERIKAIEAFEEAIALYRGDFLAEDRYAEWAEATRQALRELYLEGLSGLADCYAELGRLRQAISCCQRILGAEPYRESVIRQLMLYEDSSGHRSNALLTYEEGEKALREHLDVEPESATKALYDSLCKSTEREHALDERRLAVLPFVSVSQDEGEGFWADGMTEALIYALSQVAGLEIIAQTTSLRYKGLRRTAAEIGQELRVGSIVEGSVRHGGSKTQVLVQLIETASESHVWAQQYELARGDVLTLQDEVARSVARELRVELLTQEEDSLRRNAAIDPRAHEAYRKGKLQLSKQTSEGRLKSIRYFKQALSIDPSHTLAMAALAEAYIRTRGSAQTENAHEQAVYYIEQALKTDPGCAEAHAVRGLSKLWLMGSFREAERDYKTAIELNPNCTQALAWYAELLSNEERFKDACYWSGRALELDPLSADLATTRAVCLHNSGRLIEALEQYEEAMEIDGQHPGAWWGYWYCLAASWDWDRAEAFTRDLFQKHPSNAWASINLAVCVMCRGRLGEGLKLIQSMLESLPERKPALVLSHAGHAHYMGRKYDEAIEFYRQALRQDPMLSMNHNMIAKCYIMQERYEDALAELEAAHRVFQGDDRFWNRHTRADRAYIHVRMGEVSRAEEALEAAMLDAGRLNGRTCVASILHALGRIDEAYEWYERAATAREPHMAAALKNPRMESHLGDPRFQALLRRIGLPTSLSF